MNNEQSISVEQCKILLSELSHLVEQKALLEKSFKALVSDHNEKSGYIEKRAQELNELQEKIKTAISSEAVSLMDEIAAIDADVMTAREGFFEIQENLKQLKIQGDALNEKEDSLNQEALRISGIVKALNNVFSLGLAPKGTAQ